MLQWIHLFRCGRLFEQAVHCYQAKTLFHSFEHTILSKNKTFSALGCCNVILVIYSPSLMQEPYNVSQEMERKRAQSLILSQTKQQERRDEEVFTLSPFNKYYLYGCYNYTFRENEVNIGIRY
jgi:hypothetical protein